MSYNPVDAFGGRAGTFGSLGLGWTLDYDIAFLPFDGPQKRVILPPGSSSTSSTTAAARTEHGRRHSTAPNWATNAAANKWELKFKDGKLWKFRPFSGIPGVIGAAPDLPHRDR